MHPLGEVLWVCGYGCVWWSGKKFVVTSQGGGDVEARRQHVKLYAYIRGGVMGVRCGVERSLL